MAIRSGLAAQLGVAAETTWGTRQVPDHFYEFVSESLNNHIDRVESKALRLNNRVLRSDRWAAGKVSVDGDVQFEVANKGFGLWFKHSLGAVATTADGAGFKHSSTLGDPYSLGLTVQVGTPDVSGTVQVREYTGCKVTSWELSNSVDNILAFKASLDGKAETTSQSLATASYPSTAELFYFTQGVISLAGAAYDVTDWTLQGNVGLKTDRNFINGSALKSQQILNAMTDISGTINSEFIDLTAYNRFVNGTVAAVSLTYQTTTTYDTAKPYKIIVTLPAVRFDGDTPNVGSTDITQLALPFKVLNTGATEPITIDYYTSDTTP